MVVSKMKLYLLFFLKRIVTNFLAAFLVCLSIADGEEAEHDIIQYDIQVEELEFDYLDFPTSLVRNNSLSFSSLQRIAQLDIFTVEFKNKIIKLLSDARLKQIIQVHLHPVLCNLVKVVICKNAP